MILALAGGAAGLAIAAWGTRILKTGAAAFVPRIDEISLDLRVLLVAAGASVAAAVIFGTAPALRLSAANANEVLKEGGRGTGSARVRKGRGVMVLVECALAIVLLAGAALLLRSLNRLLSIDPGFDPRGVLTMRLEFPSEPPPTAEERRQTSAIAPARARAREQRMHDLIARVETIPGVAAVGFVDDLFIAGDANESITIPSRATTELAGELNVGVGHARVLCGHACAVAAGAIPDPRRRDAEDPSALVTGRDRSVACRKGADGRSRARRGERRVRHAVLSGDDPIGKRFCIDPTNKTYWYEIVGVVGDMHRQGLERRTVPEYFGQ